MSALHVWGKRFFWLASLRLCTCNRRSVVVPVVIQGLCRDGTQTCSSSFCELRPPRGMDPGKVRISSDLQVRQSVVYLDYE